jgi:NSS family neurotransmitter:Na+ symporter
VISEIWYTYIYNTPVVIKVMSKERDSFSSRLGFLLVSAGCAIGIGNVWKFPYIAGKYGGAVFVFFYLIFLIIIGIPVMTMELAVGRASGKTAVQGYKTLEKEGSKWHIHGWFCIAGCYLLMMYYTTVSGWMLDYFWKFASGQFNGPGIEAGEVFGNMLGNPVEMGIFMAITVLAGFGVLSLGVRNGLERLTKIMMAGLLALILALAVQSFLMPGAKEGLRFFLRPDFSKALDEGITEVITAAMNQAFFTLSLGIGSIEIFGSYMSKEHTILGESVRICALDTFVAIASGLVIFPACFSYNVQPDQGPSLIFITLPTIFTDMHWGRLWGAMFFLFMTFASFSTVTAVFENIIATMCDNFGFSRGKSILINCVFILAASIPCVLGYNVWSGLQLIGARDVLDSEDFIVSNLLLPIGSLVFLLFCVSRLGWGFDKYLEETNTGSGMKMPGTFKFYLKYILPVLILVIIIRGLI